VQRRYERGDRRQKTAVLMLAVALVLAVVTVRLIHLQVIQAERLREISDNNRLRTDTIPALRGRILDREGRVLADNRPSYCLILDTLISEYRESPGRLADTIYALSLLLGEDVDRLRKTVEEGWFRSPLGVRLECGLTDREVAAVEENARLLPGVRVEARPRRSYPNGELACHLLGTVGEVTEDEIRGGSGLKYKAGDFVGRRGVEREYESTLRGTDGWRQTQVDALGRKVGLLGGMEVERAKRGQDLSLSLDLDLQRFVEDTLSAFPRGAVAVVDMRTGGVLAMASRPAFDPNSFSRGLTRAEWRSLEADRSYPLLDRCTQSTYPPGSTFKLVTAIATLEEGLISPKDKPVFCGGYYALGNRRYGCWKETGHGRLDMTEAIAQSCSCYFYHLGRMLGVERITAWAKHLGFDKLTEIDLPVERRSFVPSPEWYDEKYGVNGWGPGLALNLAIGQGELLATPLKLVTLAMAVGGRGRWPAPHVRAGTVSEWRSWDISQATLDVLRAGMYEVVQGEHGTGRRAAVEGVAVGGKTGTAQNPHGEDHSIFVGFAPFEDPAVAIVVYLENAGHGGQNAAPLAGSVLGYYFRTLDAGVASAGGGREGMAAAPGLYADPTGLVLAGRTPGAPAFRWRVR
jgi:penicillin-binding protein 2